MGVTRMTSPIEAVCMIRMRFNTVRDYSTKVITITKALK
jgi:hypothetical protein